MRSGHQKGVDMLICGGSYGCRVSLGVWAAEGPLLSLGLEPCLRVCPSALTLIGNQIMVPLLLVCDT